MRVFAACLAVLLAAALYASFRTDAGALRARLEAVADRQQTALYQRLADQSALLSAVAALFHASERVTAAEFRRFAAMLLRHREDARALYFAEHRGAGPPSRPFDSDSFRIVFAAGPEGASPSATDAWLGAERHAAAIDTAVGQGRSVGAVAAGSSQRYVIFHPLYDEPTPPRSEGQRRRALRGIIALAMDPEQLVADLPGQSAAASLTIEHIASATTLTAGSAGERSGGGSAVLPRFRMARSVATGGEALELTLSRAMRWSDVDLGRMAGAAVLCLALAGVIAGLDYRSRVHRRLRAATRTALAREQGRARVTLQSIADGVVTTDVEGRIEYLNPAAETLSGWSLDQAAGERAGDVFRMVGDSSREPVRDALTTSLASARSVQHEEDSILLRPDGAEFAIQQSAAPIVDQDGSVEGAVMVFHDVSREREMASQLDEQSRHDPLTGLINRSELEGQTRHALNTTRLHGRRHVLCYLDLDGFELINRRCGHMGGDELLKQIAQLLRGRIRSNDWLARLEGDEFAVLLLSCRLPEAEQVAEALRKLVGEFRFVWEGETFEVGVSIGITEIDARESSPDDILSAAHSACRAAKDQGGNQVRVYRPDHAGPAQRHGEMQAVQHLQETLAEDRIALYAQPLVGLQPHRPSAIEEVLLRIPNADGVLVPFERCGAPAGRGDLMKTVDRKVIRMLLEYLGTGGAGPPGERRLMIDLSAQSLADPELADFLEDELRRAGAAASQLGFEIAEVTAVANFSRTVALIEHLGGQGWCFGLDDFGTGVSAFSHIRSLAVDYVKIDAELARSVADDPVNAAIVAAIHRVARELGLATVAQDVRDERTRARLEELGIDYAQGDHLAPAYLLTAGRGLRSSVSVNP